MPELREEEMLDGGMEKMIASAKIVAGWDEETLAGILTLAKAFKVSGAPVPVKEKGEKKDPNAPKRKYTKRVKKEGIEGGVVAA